MIGEDEAVGRHNLACAAATENTNGILQRCAPGGIDVYIINTCTVTNIADRKSRQMLHKAKKMNPNAVVVAVGCYVQTGTESVKQDECIDLAVGNNKKKDIVSILEEFLKEKGLSYKQIEKRRLKDQKPVIEGFLPLLPGFTCFSHDKKPSITGF